MAWRLSKPYCSEKNASTFIFFSLSHSPRPVSVDVFSSIRPALHISLRADCSCVPAENLVPAWNADLVRNVKVYRIMTPVFRPAAVSAPTPTLRLNYVQHLLKDNTHTSKIHTTLGSRAVPEQFLELPALASDVRRAEELRPEVCLQPVPHVCRGYRDPTLADLLTEHSTGRRGAQNNW